MVATTPRFGNKNLKLWIVVIFKILLKIFVKFKIKINHLLLFLKKAPLQGPVIFRMVLENFSFKIEFKLSPETTLISILKTYWTYSNLNTSYPIQIITGTKQKSFRMYILK